MPRPGSFPFWRFKPPPLTPNEKDISLSCPPRPRRRVGIWRYDYRPGPPCANCKSRQARRSGPIHQFRREGGRRNGRHHWRRLERADLRRTISRRPFDCRRRPAARGRLAARPRSESTRRGVGGRVRPRRNRRTDGRGTPRRPAGSRKRSRRPISWSSFPKALRPTTTRPPWKKSKRSDPAFWPGRTSRPSRGNRPTVRRAPAAVRSGRSRAA